MYNPKYFTISELTRSEVANKYGITNQPDEWETKNLLALIENVLDPTREMWGGPIRVTSGFRCAKLNSHKEIGGAKNSGHLYGFAADIQALVNKQVGNRETQKKLYETIKNSNLPYTKLIFEQKKTTTWVHVSFKEGEPNRQNLIYKDGVYSLDI